MVQDIYGGYTDFAAAVPGLGLSDGVVNRASSGCRTRPGDPCDKKWVNVATTSTASALIHFGYGCKCCACVRDALATAVPQQLPPQGSLLSAPYG